MATQQSKFSTSKLELVSCGYCTFSGTEAAVHKHMNTCIAYKGDHKNIPKLIDTYALKAEMYLNAIINYARDNEIDEAQYSKIAEKTEYIVKTLKIYGTQQKVSA